MAHAIGCLGDRTDHVAAYRTEKRIARQRAHRDPRKGRRNQDRKTTFAVVHLGARLVGPGSGPQLVKVLKVKVGHLHHVRAAYLYGRAKYIKL